MGLDDDEYQGGEDALFQVPDSDKEIIDVTKKWVDAVIADLGVCPFTVDKDRAGWYSWLGVSGLLWSPPCYIGRS